MYDSLFIDPSLVQTFDAVRIFFDYRVTAATEVDNIVITPEPASLCLIGAGALALLIRRRRR